MLGFLSAILAGAAMSVQGVMNTRLGEKVGTLETNAFVQLIGFCWRCSSRFSSAKATSDYCRKRRGTRGWAVYSRRSSR